ncbi:MAG: PAS domain S-box protein [Cytophagales bacterium]|nr:PAS domain S-box protein [Cytophagales bacterium]
MRGIMILFIPTLLLGLALVATRAAWADIKTEGLPQACYTERLGPWTGVRLDALPKIRVQNGGLGFVPLGNEGKNWLPLWADSLVMVVSPRADTALGELLLPHGFGLPALDSVWWAAEEIFLQQDMAYALRILDAGLHSYGIFPQQSVRCLLGHRDHDLRVVPLDKVVYLGLTNPDAKALAALAAQLYPLPEVTTLSTKERFALLLWQGVSLLLALVVLGLSWLIFQQRKKKADQQKKPEAPGSAAEDNLSVFRQIYQSWPDAVFVVSTSTGLVVEANALCQRFFAKKPEELLGLRPQEAGLWLLEEEHWTEELLKKGHYRYQGKHRSLQGFNQALEQELRLLGEGPEQLLLAITRDVSATRWTVQKLEETKMHLYMAMESARQGFWELNLAEHSAYCSDEFFRILGYAPQEFIPNMDIWMDWLHPDEAREHGPQYKQWKKGLLDALTYETRLRTKSGDYRWYLVSGKTVEKREGLPLRISGVLMDVNERKQQETQLKAYLQEIEALKNRLEEENLYLREEIKIDHNFGEIICQSQVYKEVLMQLKDVAKTESTVLILGETGVGKELIARSVHNISRRHKTPPRKGKLRRPARKPDRK